MYHGVWILGGHESDLAHNPTKEGALNFGGSTATTLSLAGAAQG
jgi:hypothetical protein